MSLFYQLFLYVTQSYEGAIAVGIHFDEGVSGVGVFVGCAFLEKEGFCAKAHPASVVAGVAEQKFAFVEGSVVLHAHVCDLLVGRHLHNDKPATGYPLLVYINEGM